MKYSREELVAQYGSIRAAAKALGMPESTLRDKVKKYEGLYDAISCGGDFEVYPDWKSFQDGIHSGEAKTYGTGAAIVATPDSIEARTQGGLSLEEVRELADAPEELWDVARFTTHVTPDGTKNVWARFVPKKPKAEDLAKVLREALDGYTPIYQPITYKMPKHRSTLLEIAISDHHIGKLCWDEETGENYDIKIASQRYLDAVEDLASRPNAVPDEIVFLVGSDFFHFDDQLGRTTSGTILDTDSRWQKMFATGFRTVVESIDYLSRMAPVNVLVIPGNHDSMMSFYLGHSLEVNYQNSPNVLVDNGPKPRKYFRWGNTLLGYTHGDKIKADKLPLLMAEERPMDWSQTQFHHWRTGHIHHKTVHQFMSVTVDTLPALCPADAWHHQRAFLATRAAKSFLHHKDHGQEAEFTHYPKGPSR